jgi:hypothetical protein
MTISTHTRVLRGYYRTYYARTQPTRAAQARESYKCRCRHGWAQWLIAELRKDWKVIPEEQPTPDCPVTSDLWMRYASVGRSRLSTGKAARRVLSTG